MRAARFRLGPLSTPPPLQRIDTYWGVQPRRWAAASGPPSWSTLRLNLRRVPVRITRITKPKVSVPVKNIQTGTVRRWAGRMDNIMIHEGKRIAQLLEES